jgi:hypothetical protein
VKEMKRLPIPILLIAILPAILFAWYTSKSPDFYIEIVDIDYLPENYEIAGDDFNKAEGAKKVGLHEFRNSVSKDSKKYLKIYVSRDIDRGIKCFSNNKNGQAIVTEIDLPIKNTELVVYLGEVKRIITSNSECERGELEIFWKKSNLNYGMIIFWIISWMFVLMAVLA